MRKITIVAVIFIGFLGTFFSGYKHGEHISNSAWSLTVDQIREDLLMGTYQMSLTNARACTLALDSDSMRFLARPTPDQVEVLRAKHIECKEHWYLVQEYLPVGDEAAEEYLSESIWLYEEWIHQLNYMIDIQVVMITAHKAGNFQQSRDLFEKLKKERAASKIFRDRIAEKLQEALE